MKKYITLLLAMVLALGLAAPALAYTTNTAPAQGVSPYTVDMYLVEYVSGDILGGWISMPPTDRGYAKSEVVAGVGVVNVPANYDVYEDGYRAVRFSGTNVTLNVQDNKNTSDQYSLVHTLPSESNWITAAHTKSGSSAVSAGLSPNAGGAASWYINDTDTALTHPVWPSGNAFGGSYVANTNRIPMTSSDKTYRFLVFAKVTDDEAKLSFSLTRAATFDGGVSAGGWNQAAVATATGWTGGKLPIDTDAADYAKAVMVLSEELVVYRSQNVSLGPNRYYVFENQGLRGFDFSWSAANAAAMGRDYDEEPGELLFVIEVGNRGVSQRLYMYPYGATGAGYRVHVEPSTNELVFIVSQAPTAGMKLNDQVRYGTSGYSALMNFYTDNFVNKLGFDAKNEGNLLRQADWEEVAAAAWDVKETVSIEPWTPYVSVPEVTVTNPPKTGNAGLMGFVFIAVAGAAALIVRKARS